MNAEIINVVKCFDRNSPLWTNDAEYNRMIVKRVLNHCYVRLKNRGYLFLNEVYRELGFPMTRQGQVAGWALTRCNQEDILWTIWTRKDECDVNITFEPLNDILYALPDE